MSDQFFISFPAVRGIQAGRIFYMACVPFRTIKNMFRVDTGDGSVLSRSQRDVNQNRAKKFTEYLKQNQHSFVCPALTGVIDGDGSKFIESEVDGLSNVGVLQVPMDAGLLFVDGQHRATGISHLMADNDMAARLGANNAPIMLFDDMSLEERQMAFSDINGNTAKPQQSLSDAYNHRDPLAELARYVSEVIPQMTGRVDFERNIASGNSEHLFSLKCIKEANVRFLGIKKGEPVTKEQRLLVVDFWNSWFAGIKFSGAFNQSGKFPPEFRMASIASNGVVMHAAAMAGHYALQHYKSIANVPWDNLAKIDWSRESKDFLGRCIHSELKTMKADATAIKLTANALLQGLEVPLPKPLADLEEQVFGSYQPPVLPTPTVDNLNQFPTHNINDYAKLLLPFNDQWNLTIEQLDEAGVKMNVVAEDLYQEATKAKGCLSEEEKQALRQATNDEAQSLFKTFLEGDDYQEQLPSMFLDVKQLRDAVKAQTLTGFAKLLLPHNSRWHLSVDQLIEAGDKMQIVALEHQEMAEESLFANSDTPPSDTERNEVADITAKAIHNAYSNILTDDAYINKLPKTFFNLRSLRAAVRDAKQ